MQRLSLVLLPSAAAAPAAVLATQIGWDPAVVAAAAAPAAAAAAPAAAAVTVSFIAAALELR